MWRSLAVGYAVGVALIYWITGSIVWVISPLVVYIKFLRYKNVRAVKLRFFLNFLRNNHKLFVFRFLEITVEMDIDDLLREKDGVKSIETKKKSKSRLKYKILWLFLSHFAGFTFYLSNIKIILKSKDKQLVFTIGQVKLNSDVTKESLKGAKGSQMLTEHYILISDLKLQARNSPEAKLVKNLMMNFTFSFKKDLKVSNVNVNVSNHHICFPIHTLVQQMNEFVPVEFKTHLELKQAGKDETSDQLRTETIKQYQNAKEKRLEEFIDKLGRKLVILRDWFSAIEEINFNLSDIVIDELYLFYLFLNKRNYLATFELIGKDKGLEFLTQIYFQLTVSKFNISLNKLSQNSPGYELVFSVNDTPIEYISTLMNLRLTMYHCNNRFEFFQIPNINFTIQTNLIVQTLKMLQKNRKMTAAVVKISSHISSPTVDFNSFYLGTLLHSFKQVKFYLKELEDCKATANKGNEKTENFILNFFYSSISKYLPLISLKLTVEDTIFLVKYQDSEALRTLALNMNFIGFESVTKKRLYNHNKEIIQTSVINKVDVSGIRVTYQLVYGQDVGSETYEGEYYEDATDSDNAGRGRINEEIVVGEYFTLRLAFEELPNLAFTCTSLVDTLAVDLSNLLVLTGISEIFEDVHSIAHSFYMEPGEKHVPPHRSRDFDESLEKARQLYRRYLFLILPEWFRDTRLTGNGFRCTLGSRSILIPKELLRGAFVSGNETVQNSLRKVVYSVGSWSVSLGSQQKSHDSSDRSSGANSVPESEADDVSETKQEHYWDVDAAVQDVDIDIIACDPSHFKRKKSSKKYLLTNIKFVSIPVIKSQLSSIYEESGPDYLRLATSVPSVEFNYSVFAHFVVVSSLLLLRNTVFSYRNKHPQGARQDTPLNLGELVRTETKIRSVDTAMFMPLDLKMRLQAVDVEIVSFFGHKATVCAELVRVCVQSPTVRNYWERFLVVNDMKVTMNLAHWKRFQQHKLQDNAPENSLLIGQLDFSSARLSFPYNLVIHKVFDNIGLMRKVLKQLNHSFRGNSADHVLRPKPVDVPPVVPRFKMTGRKFLMNMDDDPFESLLSAIYQSGLSEQRDRLSKLEHVAAHFPSGFWVEPTATFGLSVTDGKCVYFYRNQQVVRKARHHKPVVCDNEALRNAFDKLEVLQRSLSKSWAKRIQNNRAKFQQEIKNNPEYLWQLVWTEKYPKNFNRRVWNGFHGPPLVSGIIEDMDVTVSSVDFPLRQLPQYLHDVGKGMPLDMQYQTLVPIHIECSLGELRTHLRDYPLPFLYMPRGSSRAAHVSGNIVVLEEFAGPQSIVDVFVPLVPSCDQSDNDIYYSLSIPKTLASIKTFCTLDIAVTSPAPTRVTWGASYQPAIQQVMLNFDGFTKPPLDPSEKVGFWDKMRANVHGRVNFTWQRGGLDIAFKGARDPYKVTSQDAGFILSFADNAALAVNKNDNPKEFMVMTADTIRWIAPNHVAQPLLVWSRSAAGSVFLPAMASCSSTSVAGYYLACPGNIPDDATVAAAALQYYEKTVISLSGRVAFVFGVLFERNVDGRSRTDSFSPHYKVRLTNPKYVRDSDYDAYSGFRSHYIHMALSLRSLKSSHNSVHLSPSAFNVFFKWWQMFSGAMSLPIRHGRIFGPSKPSKKFSVYLTTIKFQFLLSQLYVCHMYRDKMTTTLEESLLDQKEPKKAFETLGIKGKIGKIKIDLHQRKLPTVVHKEMLNTTMKMMKMRFNVGEVDVEDVDIRLVKAVFNSHEKTTLKVFDDDTSWFDIDDFEELFVQSIKSLKPKIDVFPLMYTPRMMYFRKEAEDEDDAESPQSVPFGNEPSHDCMLSPKHSSIDAQIALTSTRIEELKRQMTRLGSNEDLQTRLEVVQRNHKILVDIKNNDDNETVSGAIKKTVMLQDTVHEKDFNNRFIIHNMLLKWNCNNRNLLFRYIHLLTMYKAIGHFVTNDALASINEMIYNKAVEEDVQSQSSFNFQDNKLTKEYCSERLASFDEDLRHVASANMFHNDDYLVKIVSPQIQLIDEDSSNGCILVVAPSIEMKIITVKQRRLKPGTKDDEQLEYTDVVETRIGSFLHEANIFAFYKQQVLEFSSLYFSANSYGSTSYWPPWLGVELCTNGTILKDHMMLEKTSMMLRYDRVGNLLKADGETPETQKRNKISFNIPKVVVSCDSTQYLTLYSLVWDLLMYSEPAIKEMSSKLEKLAMKTSLNNVTGLLAKIKQLQKEICILTDLERSYVIRNQFLSSQDRAHLSIITAEKEELIKQLYISMKVIALGGKQNTNINEQAEWSIRADSIICHMLVDNRKPFIDVALSNSKFHRKETSDGSNENIIQIEMMQGFTLLGNTYYQEMFSPFNIKDIFNSTTPTNPDENLITIKWSMKKPIGGIKVMKYFRVFLQPIKLQLDQITGQQIFNYIFNNEVMKKNGGETSKSKKTRTQSVAKSVDDEADIDYDDFSSEDDDVSNDSLNDPIDSNCLNINNSNDNSNNSNNNFDNFNNNSNNSNNNHLQTHKVMYHSNRSNTSFLNPFQNHQKSQEVNLDRDETTDDDDGVDIMLERANNNFNIEFFKLDSCVLCVSYKGEGRQRLVSVNNFVLKMPSIIIKRQVLSFYEITLFLKKVVIKSLLQHSGKLLGNKLKHHRLKKIKQPLYQLTHYDKFVNVQELKSDLKIEQEEQNNIIEATIEDESI